MEYPPGTSEADFASIPRRHRDDAIQEAWLSQLQGESPVLGARAYVKREIRHERKQPTIGLPASYDEPSP